MAYKELRGFSCVRKANTSVPRARNLRQKLQRQVFDYSDGFLAYQRAHSDFMSHFTEFNS